VATTRSARQGQATLEVLALIPILSALAVGVLAGLAWLGAEGQATDASIRGARALGVGADARAVALESLPAGWRARAIVTVEGDRVRVRVRSGGPFGRLLPMVVGEARR
jgi:hypothetical protein